MSLYVYNGYLVFRPKKGERYPVCLDDILFFEHHGKKVIIHTVNKQYEIRNISLTRVQEIVGDYGFIRTHRAYAVQTKKIYKLVDCGDRSAQIFFYNTDKKVAYLSRGYRGTFPFFKDNAESASSKE